MNADLCRRKKLWKKIALIISGLWNDDPDACDEEITSEEKLKGELKRGKG